MNLTQTHDLLTFIAVYDNRRFDEATVMAWQLVFADLPFDDCRAAVVHHFATSDAYLLPVHVRLGAKEIDRERRRQLREEQEAIAAEAQAADPRPLKDRSPEIQSFVTQARDGLPEGDPDTLRHGTGHWRRVRQSRERQLHAVPNPHYDPNALAKLADWPPEQVS